MRRSSFVFLLLLLATVTGGVAIASFFFDSAFPYTTYSLTAGDDVLAPADESVSTYNQFSISSVGGGTVYGLIDDFADSASPPVPTLPTWATIVVGVVLGGCGIAFAAKHQPRA